MSSQTLKVQSGEVTLHVKTQGDENNTPILFIHGYPDDQDVWSKQIDHFAKTHYVVSFDLRGMGQSTAPKSARAYKLPIIMRDIVAVADATVGDRKFHLVGHDWGSAIGWFFTGDLELGGKRLLSYTSLACPHVGIWIELFFERLGSLKPKAIWQVLQQTLHSWYIIFFHIPVISTFIMKRYADLAAYKVFQGNGISADDPYLQHPKQPGYNQSAVNGMNIYRCNVIPFVKAPAKGSVDVPVLQLVPVGDAFIADHMYDSTAEYANNLEMHRLNAKHWAQREIPDTINQVMEAFYQKLS